MDTLDIVIVAAAAVGIIAFIALAVVLVVQGRALKRLEDRIGPPVPPGAAPSLERVRAITSQPEMRVHVEGVDDAPPAGAPKQQAAEAAAAGAAGAAAGQSPSAADRAAERREQRQPAPQPQKSQPQGRSQSQRQQKAQKPSGGGASGGGNGALYALIGIVVVAVAALAIWFFALRGDGGASTPATAGTTGTTATTGTTGTAASTVADTGGPIPDSIPPVANKAAYTVAVLNASGVSGAAANRVAPRVQAAGYTLGVVDNATEQNLSTSEVQYVPGRKEVAWNLAKDLGVTSAGPVNALSEGRIGTADVVVVVGKDLAK